MSVTAIVDTGATFLCIPVDVAERLELETLETRRVETADGRACDVPYVGPVLLRVQGHQCLTGALVLGGAGGAGAAGCDPAGGHGAAGVAGAGAGGAGSDVMYWRLRDLPELQHLDEPDRRALLRASGGRGFVFWTAMRAAAAGLLLTLLTLTTFAGLFLRAEAYAFSVVAVLWPLYTLGLYGLAVRRARAQMRECPSAD